jgi:uncharacterized protein DUF397
MINEPAAFAESEFRKSSWSDPDRECVHVARRDSRVAVRDTKTAFGTADDHHLGFSPAQFDRFLTHLS